MKISRQSVFVCRVCRALPDVKTQGPVSPLSLRPLCHEHVTQYLHRSGQTFNIAVSQHCYTAIKQSSQSTVDGSSHQEEDLWQTVLRRLGLGRRGHGVIQNQLTLIVLFCHQLGLFLSTYHASLLLSQID